jgi:DNA invertase Pin-like site-specific DNA recombinase
MLTIMSGIAEFERSLIRSRCEEGIERAQEAWQKVWPARAA